MPFLDRYWWLRPVLAVVILFMVGLPLAQLADDTGIIEMIAQGKMSFSADDRQTGLLLVAIIISVIYLVASTFPARRRNIRRNAAIRGKLDLIPLAEIPSAADQPIQEPIVIQQQLRKRIRWIFFLVGIPWVLVVLVFLGFVEVYEFGEITSHLSAGSLSATDILQAIFSALLALLYVGCILIGIRSVPTALGKPFGVILDDTGVSSRSRLGRRTALRWEDVRLFEVSAFTFFGHALYPYTYRLCSTDGMIEWQETLASDNAPPTLASTPGGSALAVNLILARTGLQPRTFVKALQAEEPADATSPDGVSQLR